MEPKAQLLCHGRGYVTEGPGNGINTGSGAGHATVGGNGKNVYNFKEKRITTDKLQPFRGLKFHKGKTILKIWAV